MQGDEFEEIGTINIDCGMAWIGDAGEVARREELLAGERTGQSRISAVAGGVALTAGYGDGGYPVMVRRRADGRIAEMRIVFIEDAATDGKQETA